MTTPRHEYYETEEKLTLTIFDKSDKAQASVSFESRKLAYTNGENTLVFDPLKGKILPESCDYSCSKVKVEIRLVKETQGRWGSLVGDSPDSAIPTSTFTSAPDPTSGVRKPKKNWEGITSTILSTDKEATIDQDPNVGGDSSLNNFFQKIFADADDDTKKAMMKSYQESGGTTLSTNWDEVGKSKVEVKPPAGSEWKQWG